MFYLPGGSSSAPYGTAQTGIKRTWWEPGATGQKQRPQPLAAADCSLKLARGDMPPQRQNSASRRMIGRGIPIIHKSMPRPKPIMSSYGWSIRGSRLRRTLARKQDQQDDDRDWNSQQPKQ